MNGEEKENYAKQLAKNAKRALTAVKCALIACAVIALGLLIFVSAGFASLDKRSLLIGLIAFACAIALSLASVVTAYILAITNLKKLKKLN